MLTGHRFKTIHVSKVNGVSSGTLDFGQFIPANVIAVGSIARFGVGDDGGGVDIGILAIGGQSFSGPVLPACVARSSISRVTFSWSIDSGNATVVATLFFSDSPVSSTP